MQSTPSHSTHQCSMEGKKKRIPKIHRHRKRDFWHYWAYFFCRFIHFAFCITWNCYSTVCLCADIRESHIYLIKLFVDPSAKRQTISHCCKILSLGFVKTLTAFSRTTSWIVSCINCSIIIILAVRSESEFSNSQTSKIIVMSWMFLVLWTCSLLFQSTHTWYIIFCVKT